MTYFTTVRGKQHEWRVTVSENAVEDMRADGIEVFEAVNTIPEWAADAGLAWAWVIAQDVWDLPSRLLRNWRGK